MYIPMVGSLDSFFAAVLMSLAGCPKAYRQRAIIGFVGCDMLAGMAARLGFTVPDVLVPLAFAIAALILRGARKWPLLYAVIPILLSVDNLALGSADSSDLLQVALAGIGSGVMAWAGFAVVRSARGLCTVPSIRNLNGGVSLQIV